MQLVLLLLAATATAAAAAAAVVWDTATASAQVLTLASLPTCLGVQQDRFGRVYYTAYIRHVVYRIDSGVSRVVAGTEDVCSTSASLGDGGSATSATLNEPWDVAVDSTGCIYIADRLNNRVRKVNTAGTISTLAGTGIAGFSGDGGAASAAQLSSPMGVGIDSSDNVYICDTSNNRVRMVSASTSKITTIIGTGSSGCSEDGLVGTATAIGAVWKLSIDSSGNVFFADVANSLIRKLNAADGTVQTVAGTVAAGTGGFNGDGIPATSAYLWNADGVSVDYNGDVWIADRHNNRVRRVSASTGTISTVAGTGAEVVTSTADGSALSVDLNCVTAVWAGSDGLVYFCDEFNGRLRLIAPYAPSTAPTPVPTAIPTLVPTAAPSGQPTRQPSSKPSRYPSSQPTWQPSSAPSARPSSQPSSAPSRQPTRASISTLGANPLTAPWSTEYVKAKTLAYLGPYALYLAAWLLLMRALQLSGIIDGVNGKLLRSAFGSGLHRSRDPREERGRVRTIVTICEGDAKIEKGKDGQLVDRDGLLDKDFAADFNHGEERFRSLQLFYDRLLDRRAYLGCQDVLFEGGFMLPFARTALARGLAEDFVLHQLNNHNMLSCCFAAKGSSLSRRARQVCWLTQHSAGLAIAAFIDSLLMLVGVPVYLKPVVNLLLVRPVVISLVSLLRALYMRGDMCECLSYVTFTMFVALAFTLLVFAAILTPPGVDRFYLIAQYFLQVHLVSIFTDAVNGALLQETGYHLGLFVGPKSFVMIGQRLCEVIVIDGLVEGIDYRAMILPMVVLRIDYISPRAALGSVKAAAKRVDTGASLATRSSDIQMTTNPMLIMAQKQQQQQQSPLPPPPPPPSSLPIVATESVRNADSVVLQQVKIDPAGEEQERGREQALPGDSTVDIGMEDGIGVTLRRFGAEVRPDYTNVFHYFQARDQGAVSATTIEGVDLEQLRSGAVYQGGDMEEEEVAITGLRRGSVLAMAHKYEVKDDRLRPPDYR